MSKTTKIRVWPSLDLEIYEFIKELAEKERRNVTEMTEILIENAVNERKRKRKNAKETSED